MVIGMREKLMQIIASKPERLRNLNISILQLYKFADHLIANDVVPVVRCKDCKHSYDGVANLMCGRCGQNINGIRLGGVSVKEEHFCSHGERRCEDG
jgi:rRNA maturation endonuclease Nob1